VSNTIIAANGKTVATQIQKIKINTSSSDSSVQNIEVKMPVLWSVETPTLYKAITEIKEGDRILDKAITTFGIRSIEYSATNGFLLNGKKTLLKGVVFITITVHLAPRFTPEQKKEKLNS